MQTKLNNMQKEKKWFRAFFDSDESDQPRKKNSKKLISKSKVLDSVVDIKSSRNPYEVCNKNLNLNHKNWMKVFDPVTVDDLAIHSKKIQEVEEWMCNVNNNNNNDMLLLSGPVGCGKTITVQTLAAKYNIRITEWITPIDIDIPTEYGEYEFKEKQSIKFLDFILKAANYTSLLDNNSSKLVLVEDFPNTFIRTPSEFSDILHKYKQRAKSPIVFICSESHMDNKNSTVNLFTPSLKEQYQIHHITFNSVSVTGLKSALKRVSDIITKNYNTVYNTPSADTIECVVNSCAGDVRSAVLTLHFACLKGSTQNLETSFLMEKEKKTKARNIRKTKPSSKFTSLGKDQSVSILHGVGRVLNPKVLENGKFTHAPAEIIEQFISQPISFLNFLQENYLGHFSNIDYVDRAASILSDSDIMLAEWREKMCQEYGLYTAIAGLMIANKTPVSAWNPVRGPKNYKINYPTCHELKMLDENYLYKGKTLVSDYKTYCNIINKSYVNS